MGLCSSSTCSSSSSSCSSSSVSASSSSSSSIADALLPLPMAALTAFTRCLTGWPSSSTCSSSSSSSSSTSSSNNAPVDVKASSSSISWETTPEEQSTPATARRHNMAQYVRCLGCKHTCLKVER